VLQSFVCWYRDQRGLNSSPLRYAGKDPADSGSKYLASMGLRVMLSIPFRAELEWFTTLASPDVSACTVLDSECRCHHSQHTPRKMHCPRWQVQTHRTSKQHERLQVCIYSFCVPTVSLDWNRSETAVVQTVCRNALHIASQISHEAIRKHMFSHVNHYGVVQKACVLGGAVA
jgi:hypothetical protein